MEWNRNQFEKSSYPSACLLLLCFVNVIVLLDTSSANQQMLMGIVRLPLCSLSPYPSSRFFGYPVFDHILAKNPPQETQLRSFYDAICFVHSNSACRFYKTSILPSDSLFWHLKGRSPAPRFTDFSTGTYWGRVEGIGNCHCLPAIES